MRSLGGTMRNESASPRFTLDTNLLVYSVDSAAGVRHDLSAEIALGAVRQDCWLTFQAVSEFYAAVTRKRIVPANIAAARANDWLTAFPCAAVSAEAVRIALTNAVARRASYWDALLVATAAEAGCTLVLTEDLAHGTTLSGVEIHNPFTRSGGLTRRVQRLLRL